MADSLRRKTEDARIELAAAYRLCVRFGFHEAIDNHLSLRVPHRRDEFFLNPFPLHWSEVQASNLICVNLAGKRVEGTYEVEPTAYFIHAAIQRAHEGHRCVMHTHMPWATAISCRAGGRVLPVHQHMLGLYDRIAYLDDYEGEVLSEEYGAKLASALGDKDVLFLANHGVITVGSSVARAFERLYYLERVCQFQLLAESGGHPLQEIRKEVLEAGARHDDPDKWSHAEKHFAALRRVLDREEPDYKL